MQPTTNTSLNPITADRFGAQLDAETGNRVNAHAQKLAELGFRQQNRPTLFKLQTAGKLIYADLDRTKKLPIQAANCAAGVYYFPKPGDTDCRECTLAGVEKLLREKGVACRRYFDDPPEHDCGKPPADRHWEELPLSLPLN